MMKHIEEKEKTHIKKKHHPKCSGNGVHFKIKTCVFYKQAASSLSASKEQYRNKLLDTKTSKMFTCI